jgi:hypothetical protein
MLIAMWITSSLRFHGGQFVGRLKSPGSALPQTSGQRAALVAQGRHRGSISLHGSPPQRRAPELHDA